MNRYIPITLFYYVYDTVRLDSPIFAKQGNSGSPDGDGSARPIDVPHCESNLGTLGEVWVLDWQPQPLVPAAQDSRRERGSG